MAFTFEIIDAADAPENLSNMSKEAQEKLAILEALKPGKAIKVPVTEGVKGYKAALSRLATRRKMTVEVWDVDGFVYVSLAQEKAKE